MDLMDDFLKRFPCINCITFIICKNVSHIRSSNRGVPSLPALMERCELMRQYLQEMRRIEMVGDEKTIRFFKIFYPLFERKENE